VANLEHIRGLLAAAPNPAMGDGLLSDSNKQLPIAEYFVDYIKLKEGKPYLEATMPTKDPNDRLTIGWGHTKGVKKGQKITLEQAEQLLLDDIEPRLKKIQEEIPKFKSFPRDVQIPLMYSMFRGSFMQSGKTRDLMRSGKYKKAEAEWLDNKEYRDALKPNALKPGVAHNDFIPTRDALRRLQSYKQQ
tara:strand:+ start:125 stop:691 length:567 start_codon:yes stop_codon:yes gene_type:complete